MGCIIGRGNMLGRSLTIGQFGLLGLTGLFLIVPHQVFAQQAVPPASVVDLPIADLLQKYPEELQGVDLNGGGIELERLLNEISQGVDEFLRTLPNTVSKEHIRQEMLGSDGKVQDRVDQDVSYLLLLSFEDNRLDWEEARTDSKGKTVAIRRLEGTSMLTSGYAMECILFSPRLLAGSRFRYLGRQVSEPHAYLIAFAQKPGQSAPGIFRMSGVQANLLSQGLAWVDPVNHQIIRMRSDMLEPLPQLGLVGHTTQITYAEHHFSSSPASFWLPEQVVVTIQFGSRTYRNTHRYSDYKLFSVESYEKREPIRPPQ